MLRRHADEPPHLPRTRGQRSLLERIPLNDAVALQARSQTKQALRAMGCIELYVLKCKNCVDLIFVKNYVTAFMIYGTCLSFCILPSGIHTPETQTQLREKEQREAGRRVRNREQEREREREGEIERMRERERDIERESPWIHSTATVKLPLNGLHV